MSRHLRKIQAQPHLLNHTVFVTNPARRKEEAMQVFGGNGGADDEVQAFVEKDRCEHADCYYSTSSSRSCRTINGESKCELVRRVLL